VVLWGDGSASREFLYAEDCARGIRLALERYNGDEPVNIGTGSEITIKALALKIKRLMAFKGEIAWDKSKPNGQPRRCLDVSRAKKYFGFTARTNLDTGLKRTIQWYRQESN
jgi:GDP-L-fucose synthase